MNEVNQHKDSTIVIMTPKYLEIEPSDDFFERFVKQYYFPFLVRNSRLVLLGWLAVFAVTIVYGPPFLSATVIILPPYPTPPPCCPLPP